MKQKRIITAIAIPAVLFGVFTRYCYMNSIKSVTAVYNGTVYEGHEFSKDDIEVTLHLQNGKEVTTKQFDVEFPPFTQKGENILTITCDRVVGICSAEALPITLTKIEPKYIGVELYGDFDSSISNKDVEVTCTYNDGSQRTATGNVKITDVKVQDGTSVSCKVSYQNMEETLTIPLSDIGEIQTTEDGIRYLLFGKSEIGIVGYEGKENHIVIPDTIDGKKVTEIRTSAFANTKIASVQLPSGLKKINAHAFENCLMLTEISFPDGLEQIGDSCFQGCSELNAMAFPDSLKRIGTYAFSDCEKITDVYLDKNISEVGENAWYTENHSVYIWYSGSPSDWLKMHDETPLYANGSVCYNYEQDITSILVEVKEEKEYYEEEVLDSETLEVTALYSNGSRNKLNSFVVDSTPLQLGENKVSVHYGKVSTDISVTANPKPVPFISSSVFVDVSNVDTSHVLNTSPEADMSYFDDVIFIGDSVTMALKNCAMTTDITGNADFFCGASFGSFNDAKDVTSDSVHPSYKGTKMKVAQAVQASGRKKVYIMLGMNDVGYGYQRAHDQYVTLIEGILALCPDVEIIVESVTPRMYCSNVTSFTPLDAAHYNALMMQTCAEKGWYYLDVAAALQDDNGYLISDYCSDKDGMALHFTNKGCEVWIDYLKTHKAP